jgi:flagellin
MTSINTNTSAIAALQSLRSVNASLQNTQRHVSTGFRVEKASDNAAYWSVATTMRSDNKAISAVQDALGMSSAVVDTAYTAVSASIDVMSEIKAKIVTAHEKGADKTKIDEELTQLKQQLRSTIETASFNGQNWLAWDSGDDSNDKQIVGSFVRDGNGGVQLAMMNYAINTPTPLTDTNVQYFVDNGGSGEYGILSSGAFAFMAGAAKNYIVLKGATIPPSSVEITLNNATTTAELGDMLKTVESMTKQMVAVGATLGSLGKRVDMQASFAKYLSDSIDSGVGRLVDANMEEESSRLSAAQTQQQLAIQSLSIANSAPRNILNLFQG